MATPHINAKLGDFSDVVLMSGDPLRAKYIAEQFLTNSLQINNVRGMLGFTGKYKNRRISVIGHGIGIPSCSIYMKELITDFGVKVILRVGSCGAINNKVKIRDIIVGMGACTDSRVNRLKFNNNDYAAIADYNLIANVLAIANKKSIKIMIGNIFTTDLFYTPIPHNSFFDTMEKYGILAVEMEAAGIYSMAAEYNVKALTICTVSDHIRRGEKITSSERETTFNEMIDIALESVLLLD